jgi:hypothetical protein
MGLPRRERRLGEPGPKLGFREVRRLPFYGRKVMPIRF